MRFFLLGAHDQNAGPSNVNKSLIRYSGKEMMYIHFKNKYIRNLEIVCKILFAKKILISGVCAPRFYKMIRMLKKRYSYLMHGCIEYENRINKLNVTSEMLLTEAKVLKNADHIICVSEDYTSWVKKRYLIYKDKIIFVNNGINLMQRPKICKNPYTVAVSGGNRCIKNNIEVYRAVEALNKEGIPCKLFVFGRNYSDNDKIPETEYITYCGHLDKEEYYNKLDRISCFILNSEVEPFGLVVADALNCNCSLLISKNVGSKCIMRPIEQDIIQNPHNINELIQKIKRVFIKPNSSRLFDSINLKECSEERAYKKLKNIIEE